ncbi:MAG: DNA polymerase III subunit beta [Chloroflexota bacterium]|nr:DNA polymerase III subunit beta [Chloroflexota bacterium]
MFVSVMQEQLARGLGMVGRAVDSRPTLPVLANVLLATEDARLKLVATNLELTIVTFIGAKVNQPGAITLPSKTLAELVNNLSPERVDLQLDTATQSMRVMCGTTRSDIKGISASEFPPSPEELEPDVLVPGKVLREMINQTAFAASKEDTRPILTGLLTRFEDNVMTMAAADGYRLAVRTAQIEQSFPKMREVVIPARSLLEVARIIGDDDEPVGISLPGKRDLVMFYIKSTIVSSQVLEGRFPDFAAIIPRSYSTSTVLYTDDLLRACKRAEIFARDSANSARLYVKPPTSPNEPGELMVIGKSAERGENEGMLDAAVEGEPLETSFNIRYLIDALSVVNNERVVLQSNGSAHPGVMRPEGSDNFIYVLMPMQVQR